jgi:hypothetical protein
MTKPTAVELKAIHWLRPWEAFPDVQEPRTEGEFTGYDLELVREVGPKHPLFSFKSLAIPIAARGDCDDRLYWIPNEENPFVVVHLTWAGKKQQRSPDHPTTTFYKSFEDWKESCMEKDRKSASQVPGHKLY